MQIKHTLHVSQNQREEHVMQVLPGHFCCSAVLDSSYDPWNTGWWVRSCSVWAEKWKTFIQINITGSLHGIHISKISTYDRAGCRVRVLWRAQDQRKPPDWTWSVSSLELQEGDTQSFFNSTTQHTNRMWHHHNVTNIAQAISQLKTSTEASSR